MNLMHLLNQKNVKMEELISGQRNVMSSMATEPAADVDDGWGAGCDRHDITDVHPRDNSACLARLSAASHSPEKDIATFCKTST